MGYHAVDVDSVEPETGRPCECRKLADAANSGQIDGDTPDGDAPDDD
ncbi:hypothetical protein JCM18237_20520 [Halorubrum luteum]